MIALVQDIETPTRTAFVQDECAKCGRVRSASVHEPSSHYKFSVPPSCPSRLLCAAGVLKSYVELQVEDERRALQAVAS